MAPLPTEAGVSSPLFQPAPELCALPEVEPLASRVGSGPAACSSFGAGVSDVLSGLRFPLARAFSWAGWRVVTPIDLLIDKDFDINSQAVCAAIFHVLPQVHLLSCAVAYNTKSRAREISRPGMSLPEPLRSAEFPRGLPELQPKDAARVAQDNEASDVQLALQQAVHEAGRGAFRENPRRSWHWQDPVEASLPGWTDFDYDACCFQGARRKSQRIRHNLPELAMLPSPVCGHTHSPNEWQPASRDGVLPFFPRRTKLSTQRVSSLPSWSVRVRALICLGLLWKTWPTPPLFLASSIGWLTITSRTTALVLKSLGFRLPRPSRPVCQISAVRLATRPLCRQLFSSGFPRMRAFRPASLLPNPAALIFSLRRMSLTYITPPASCCTRRISHDGARRAWKICVRCPGVCSQFPRPSGSNSAIKCAGSIQLPTSLSWQCLWSSFPGLMLPSFPVSFRRSLLSGLRHLAGCGLLNRRPGVLSRTA